jgi:3-deoxy-7-phosphoheptulonate synthase
LLRKLTYVNFWLHFTIKYKTDFGLKASHSGKRISKVMSNYNNLDNSPIETPILKPNEVLKLLPITPSLADEINNARDAITSILKGKNPRLLVIVGPCSLHDERAAIEYAHYLKQAAEKYHDQLYLVMRTYFAKPRTKNGWKGYIYDPFLNGSYEIEKGILLTRKLLIQLGQILPLACEFLDIVTPAYLKDLISWGAIGARTSASQTHRELASGLPMPIGFKNSVDGNIQVAVNAAQSAATPHHYLGLNAEGLPAMMHSKGNSATHIILRGSNQSPNYSSQDLNHAIELLTKANLEPQFIVDCSHGNSAKQHERQALVVNELISFIQNAVPHTNPICGIMLESFLESGKQKLNPDDVLVYGKSITDACLSWHETEIILEKLAKTWQDYRHRS